MALEAWNSVRLDRLIREVSRPADGVDLAQFDEIGVRSHGKGIFFKEPTSADDLGDKRVFWIEPGDLVFNIVFAWEGAVAVAGDDVKGRVGSHRFPTFRPIDQRCDVRFLKYLFTDKTGLFLLGENSPGGAGRNRTLSREGLLKEYVSVPPCPIQQAIANFLDEKTAAIDDLIAQKQRLIDLLQEKRTALINRAVTKGLDPNVPMKDSGIPWIGEIPAHWGVMPLRLHARVVDCKHRTPNYLHDGFPVVSTTEVKPGRLDLSVATRRVDHDDFMDMTENRCPRRGDIIYSRNASLGAAAYVATDEPFAMGQDVVLIAKGSDLLYLSYLLNSQVGMSQVDFTCIGSTFKRINVGQIKQLQVCVPPPDEAQDIAIYLDGYDCHHNELRALLLDAVARLQEYRQALITAAVTGKLNVSAHEHTKES